MGTTKNGKIEPPNISLYWVEGQYFVGCFAMLIFSGEVGIQCPFSAPKDPVTFIDIEIGT